MTADEVLKALKEAGFIDSTEKKPARGYWAIRDNKIIKTIRELEDKKQP